MEIILNQNFNQTSYALKQARYNRKTKICKDYKQDKQIYQSSRTIHLAEMNVQ